jgi:hypothetical protein
VYIASAFMIKLNLDQNSPNINSSLNVKQSQRSKETNRLRCVHDSSSKEKNQVHKVLRDSSVAKHTSQACVE